MPQSLIHPSLVPLLSDQLREYVETLTVSDDLAIMANLPGIEQIVVTPDVVEEVEYGIPTGVAIHQPLEGAYIYPNAVGDPNCGFRIVATNLVEDDLPPKALGAVQEALRFDPAELLGGSVKLDLKRVLTEGAPYLVGKGIGQAEDLSRIEGGGQVDAADPSAVPQEALDYARAELLQFNHYGHFIELNVVDRIASPEALAAYGLRPGQVVMLIHNGSAVAGAYAKDHFFEQVGLAAIEDGVIDPEWVARGFMGTPLNSALGQHYLSAYRALANLAYARRHTVGWLVARALTRGLGWPEHRLETRVVSDLGHNALEVVTGGKEPQFSLRHGVQRLDVTDKQGQVMPAVVGSSPGVPSLLVCGQAASKVRLSGHGNVKKAELWRRLPAADAEAVRAWSRKVSYSHSEIPTSDEVELQYENLVEVRRSLEQHGVAQVLAELRPLLNLQGLRKDFGRTEQGSRIDGDRTPEGARS